MEANRLPEIMVEYKPNAKDALEDLQSVVGGGGGDDQTQEA
jgi:hypothetical protein